MAEYIKRENVLAEIDEFVKQNIAHGFPVDVFDIEMMKKMVEKLPAADVAPVVHGKWLNFYNDFSCAECDRCGTTFEVTDNESDEFLWNEFKLSYNYCPNCGAKMDEEMKRDG